MLHSPASKLQDQSKPIKCMCGRQGILAAQCTSAAGQIMSTQCVAAFSSDGADGMCCTSVHTWTAHANVLTAANASVQVSNCASTQRVTTLLGRTKVSLWHPRHCSSCEDEHETVPQQKSRAIVSVCNIGVRIASFASSDGVLRMICHHPMLARVAGMWCLPYPTWKIQVCS